MAYENPEIKLDDLDNIIKNIDVESETDYTKVENVYFAFIDVLGFKKIFDDIRISEVQAKADKYRDVFNYYFKLMNHAKFMNIKDDTGCYAGQTSDSLYFYTERPDFLVQFMRIFSHFSLYAMSKDVFFRGGIAKGDLYKKEKYQFYGDSVIYAYLLESVISKYPIIVIDENTHIDMQTVDGYKELVGMQKERHYIKPFAFLNKNVTLDTENFHKRKIDSEQVKKNIEDNKKLFEYDPKNYEKYVFLENELKDVINIEK